MMVDPEVEDRADAAFRAALQVDELAEVGVEPHAVRERLRRRRGLVAAVAAAVVVVLALATVPLLRQFSIDNTAGDPSVRIPPAGWRIEQYRDVSIFVPESWGYASAPWVDWCGASPDGQPLPAQQKPYVSLGVPNALAPTGGAPNGCPDPPKSLLSEHVELDAPLTSLSDSPSPTTEREGDWWVLVRIFHPDLDPTVVKIVSRDHDLAEQIADSAAVGGPCPATSPVQENQLNQARVDLASFTTADRAVICQYKPGLMARPTTSSGESLPTGGIPRLGGLAAASVLSEGAARSLAADLRAASRAEPVTNLCRSDLVDMRLAIEIRLFAGDREGSVFLVAGNCERDNYPDLDGIDLGSAIYPWTKQVCDDVIALPVVAADHAGSWICSR